MVKVDLYDNKGKVTKTVDVSDNVLKVSAPESLVSLGIRIHMNNKRAGLAKVKEKFEVRGGGQKPFRQKGLGRARQGSTRSPQFVGGGTVFGPRGDANYKRTLPKKVRRQLLFSVLSEKYANKKFALVDFGKWDDFSTKKFNELVKNLPEFRKAKFVLDTKDHDAIIKSGDNVKSVSFTTYNRLPLDEVVGSDFVFFDVNALNSFLELYKINS